jgi:hypothetical protein
MFDPSGTFEARVRAHAPRVAVAGATPRTTGAWENPRGTRAMRAGGVAVARIDVGCAERARE